MTETSASPPTTDAPPGFLSPYQRARILLFSAAVICFCAFFWGSRAFDIPNHPGHEASLIQQPSPGETFILVGVGIAACVAIGSALAGIIRFNAGLFTAGIGLMALSLRGGTTRDVIFHGMASAGSPSLFLSLAVETAVLAMILAGLWGMLLHLHRTGVIRDREGAAAFAPANNHLPSLALQTAVTGIVILVLAASEAKAQVLMAVAIASFVASAAAQGFLPTNPRGVYWLPPLLIGLIGYVLTFFFSDGMSTADLKHAAAPLAFPLPIDYAGIGMASAIVGHWIARQWSRPAISPGSAGS